jgi:hypothetical protein
MPVDHLIDVLPSDSNLSRALSPTTSITQTGVISGWQQLTGHEPYLFDADDFVIMGDLAPNGDTQLSNVLPLNGDLYLFGSWSNPNASGDMTIRWDAQTRTWQDLTAPFDWDQTYSPNLLNGRIYFSYVDFNASFTSFTMGVAVLDGGTDQVSVLQLPVAGNAYRTQLNGGKLIVQGSFDGGVDLITYDPSAQAGSQFQTYSLPDNAVIYGNVYGNAGTFTYYLGSVGSVNNLYSFNASTGAISIAVNDMNYLQSETEGSVYPHTGSLNGDLYFFNYTDSGQYQILRADDQTGQVTAVYSAPGPGGVGYLLLMEEASSLWFGSQSGTLVRVASDGTASAINTSASAIYEVEEMNGVVYLTAAVGSDVGIYSMAGDGSLTFVSNFAGPGVENVIGSIDNHLVVLTDFDGNGFLELWTSAQPGTDSSWTQISPNDVHVDASYVNMLMGDYIL